MRAWERKQWASRLRALHGHGLKDKAIAQRLGVSPHTVFLARLALGLPSVTGRGPNLTALHAEARPGCCLGCDAVLVQTPGLRRRVLCSEEECQKLYYAAARTDSRLRAKQGRAA